MNLQELRWVAAQVAIGLGAAMFGWPWFLLALGGCLATEYWMGVWCYIYTTNWCDDEHEEDETQP